MNRINKQEIRNTIRSIRDNIPEEQISEKSKTIIQHLKDLDEFKKANIVMSYLSLKSEVNTIELIKEQLQQKTVIIPFVEENNIKISKLSDFNDLKEGNFGVLEPIKKEEYKENLDIVLVPGIAFDQSGARIGFGKGFYDRFLKDRNSLKIGLAFEEQITKNIPTEDYDIPMDMIITEKRVIRCK